MEDWRVPHSIPKLPIQPIQLASMSLGPSRVIKIQIGKDLLHLCLMSKMLQLVVFVP